MPVQESGIGSRGDKRAPKVAQAPCFTGVGSEAGYVRPVLLDPIKSLQEMFDRDIREYVLLHLPCRPQDRAALERERASDLLIIYFNWLHRLIDAQPRQVHLSEVLAAQPFWTGKRYGGALSALRNKIEIGGDLTPHLSKGVRIGFQERTRPKKLQRRLDLDLLLNDWGIHHLHLSSSVEPDGFVTRDGPLLLGVFQPGEAYLVDIIDHGDWSRQSIMEIAIRNWPDAGIAYELKSVLGLERSVDDVDRKQLRNAGINVPLEIGGKVYMSPQGLSSAGTSIRAAMRAQQIRRDIDWFCRKLEAEPLWPVGLLLQAGLPVPSVRRFKFMFLDDGYGVLEQNSGYLIRLQ